MIKGTFKIKPHGLKRESVKKGRDLKRALKTPTVHSLAISLKVYSICTCSGLYDLQLFYANKYVEEDHSLKTCIELITPRHGTGSELLFRGRPQQDSVFHPIFDYLFHFLRFIPYHLPPQPSPNLLMHGTYLFLLPELRWMSLIWNCASLSFGMSFQVARNTWRSEEQKDKRSSCERTTVKKKKEKKKKRWKTK